MPNRPQLHAMNDDSFWNKIILENMDLHLSPSRGGDDEDANNLLVVSNPPGNGGSIHVHVDSGLSSDGGREALRSGASVSTQLGSTSAPSRDMAGHGVVSRDVTVSFANKEASVGEDDSIVEVKSVDSPTSSKATDEA